MATLPDSHTTGFRRLPVSALITLVIAVFLSAWSGFFIMDFLLSGIYTWIRSSRALALICAIFILSYEFVYKEHHARHAVLTGIAPLKVVWYCCVIPYLAGMLALLALVNFG